MLIQPTYTDDHLLLLDITVEAADYEPELKKKVKDFAKTAKMPGFRPGMVPQPMIRKMIGAQVIDETLKKLLNEALVKYVQETKLVYLGEAIQVSEGEKIEPQLSKNYTFTFEFGLMPEFNTPDYSTISLTKYNIAITEKDINDEITELRKRASEITKPEDATVEENDTIKILFQETDEADNVKTDGISHTIDINVSDFKNETERQKLIGLAINQSTPINVFDAFEQDNNLIARVILGLKDGYTNNLPNTYQATVTEITRYQLPELNPGFYEKVFTDPILTEEDFRTKISEKLQQDFVQLSENQFLKDIEQYLIKNTPLNLPETFIRKYMQLTGGSDKKPLSDQEVEQRYPKYIESTRLTIIRGKIASLEGLSVEEDDIENYAYAELQNQMMQYGMYNITSEWEKYIQKRLEDPKYINQAAAGVLQFKVNQVLSQKINPIEQDITADEFSKLHAQ